MIISILDCFLTNEWFVHLDKFQDSLDFWWLNFLEMLTKSRLVSIIGEVIITRLWRFHNTGNHSLFRFGHWSRIYDWEFLGWVQLEFERVTRHWSDLRMLTRWQIQWLGSLPNCSLIKRQLAASVIRQFQDFQEIGKVMWWFSIIGSFDWQFAPRKIWWQSVNWGKILIIFSNNFSLNNDLALISVICHGISILEKWWYQFFTFRKWLTWKVDQNIFLVWSPGMKALSNDPTCKYWHNDKSTNWNHWEGCFYSKYNFHGHCEVKTNLSLVFTSARIRHLTMFRQQLAAPVIRNKIC